MVPTHGLPLLLQAGLEVVPVPPALKGPRSLVVASCDDGRSGQLVSFEGVSTLGAAAELEGKTLLARTDDLPRDYALHDVDALVGREVADETHGLLGSIREVMRGPANDVWVVVGDKGEVLIPAVEPIVRSWDKDAAIVVDLPRGLVEEASSGEVV